jgi:hypothetical protein
MVLSAPNLILFLLFLNIFVTTRISWTQQEGKFIHILHYNFEFLLIFRIFVFLILTCLFICFFTTTAFILYIHFLLLLRVMWGHIHVKSLSSTSHICEGWYFCAFWCNDRYTRNKQACVSSSLKLDSSTLEHETSTLSWKFGKETPINAASHPIRAH